MAVVLYDANNNKIDHLTQWDKKQTIVIKGLSVSAAPEFHIANASCREAIRVTSVLDNGALTVSIPDEILEDGLPFLMYAYQMDSSGSAQTIYTIGVPVHPRQKPADYIHEETDGTQLTWWNLKNGFGSRPSAEEGE